MPKDAQLDRPGGWTFFATMSLAVASVIVAGFGPTYTASLAPPGLPLWVHVHGLLMTSWIVLFVVQAALVRRRSLALHRTLGAASIALVIPMVPLAIATDLLAIQRGATPPFFTPAQMFSADVCDILLFAALFTWALVVRDQTEWHKRLLLCATVLLTWPAIGRLMSGIVGMQMVVPISVALLIGFALIGPLHDYWTNRRVHPAYICGVGLIVLAQPLHVALATSGIVQAIVRSVAPAPGKL